MKKITILTAFFCTLAIISTGQPAKWFFTLSNGGSVGGAGCALKKAMRNKGWNEKSYGSFFGLVWNTEYPIKTQFGSILMAAGKKLKEGKSIFLTSGLADFGEVKGLKYERYNDPLSLRYSYGRYITVKYKVWQLTGGYQYTLENSTSN